jgi:hypothetical protein
MKTFIAHPRKQLLFTAMSLADLFLTCFLLRESGGRVYEGNPVADWWLNAWGWVGLACFKVFAVLLVVGLSAAVSVRRPALGGKVLIFGCTVLTGVLLYSCALVGEVQANRRYHQVMARARWLERAHESQKRFNAIIEALGNDLLRRRRTLAEAVGALARTEKARDQVFLNLLRDRNPACSDLGLLAVSLIENTLELVAEKPAQAEAIFQRLRGEYEAIFGQKAICLDWTTDIGPSPGPPQVWIRVANPSAYNSPRAGDNPPGTTGKAGSAETSSCPTTAGRRSQPLS